MLPEDAFLAGKRLPLHFVSTLPMLAQGGATMEDLTDPYVTRGGPVANSMLIRVASKLGRLERFLRDVQWGLPSTSVGCCPWCGQHWRDDHAENCVLAETLRASGPIENIGTAVMEARDLLAQQQHTISMYLDGILREMDDSQMVLQRLHEMIDRL